MMISRETIVATSIVTLLAGVRATEARAADPVKNPTEHARGDSEDEKEGNNEGEPLEVPTVDVEGHGHQTKANDPIGAYGQPSWTLDRPFSQSRVYVNPPAETEISVFYTPAMALDDLGEASIKTEIELESGIGHRLQLDLYLVTEQDGWDGPLHVSEEKFELRWAFADWGEIWGNPTLYLEFAHAHEGPPSIEPKLLLGGNLGEKWFGAANVVYERELGGDQEQEYAVSLAIQRVVSDPELFVGFEGKAEMKDKAGERFDFSEYELLAGPSVQWYPVATVHVGLNTLFGVELEREDGETHTEPLFEPMFTVGFAI